MKKSLLDLHNENNGKVSDKWSSYLEHYDKELESLRDKKISLLEIGVQNGGSLETWAKYFTEFELILGCDINQECKKLKYDDNRIKIIVGDINNQHTFESILEISNSFDLIIDDGSHKSIDILNSFINYFEFVKPGGKYIIEDTHCLYMKDYGGGVLNKNSAQYFFKELTDIINYQWWENYCSMDSYLQSYFPNGLLPSFIIDGWVDSISFRNSIITINKSQQPTHNKIGKRIISGKEMKIHNFEN